METLRTFDENYHYIKDESRDVVHREGLWHETFHCWLIDEAFIYIQKRSATKKDFPSLFDITAAGHLEADETVEDGVREIEEELGVHVDFSSLIKIGIIRDIIELPSFYDYEFAHVYLHKVSLEQLEFSLQEEEVEGIYTIKKEDFIDLCMQKVDGVQASDFTNKAVTTIRLRDFVPHQQTYFETIAKALLLAEKE